LEVQSEKAFTSRLDFSQSNFLDLQRRGTESSEKKKREEAYGDIFKLKEF